MSRRSRRAREPRLLDAGAGARRSRTVEEAGVVEPLGEAGRSPRGPGTSVAVARPDDLVDLGHGSLAVEERDDVEGGNGEEDDLLGEARRVAEPDEPLAVLLDREGFERPEPRAIRGGPC